MKMNNGRKSDRQKEAKIRQDERNKLSNKQQIQKLDNMFGVGLGAKKERLKLSKIKTTNKKKKVKDENDR